MNFGNNMGRMFQQQQNIGGGGRMFTQKQSSIQEKEEGFPKKAGRFLADITGAKSLYEQGGLIGRAVGTGLATKEQEKVAKSRGGLADLTTKLIKKLKDTPEGARKRRMKKIIRDNMKEMNLSKKQEKALEEQMITTQQVIGKTLEAGLTVATYGTKAPVGLGKRVLTGAGLGATFTGARELAKTGKVTPSRLVTGAAIGGALPIVAAGAGAIFKAITKRLPKRFIQSAIKQKPTELLRRKDLTDYVVKNKKIGSAENLVKGSQKAINELDDKILKKIAKVGGTVSPKKIAKQVANEINKQGGSITTQEVLDIVKKLAPQSKGLLSKSRVRLPNTNKIRQGLDRTLGDRGFLKSQLTFNKEVLRTFTNTLRETVKKRSPSEVRVWFDHLSKEIRLRDTLLRKITVGEGRTLISFGDLIGGGLGGAVGGIPGAFAGAALRRGLQSTTFLTGAGVSLAQLGMAGQKLSPLLQKLAPAQRVIILNAISAAINQGTSTQKEK